MHIIWHGQSCFQIIAIRGKGEQVLIVIDPFSEKIGLRLPKIEADVLLITHNHPDHNNIKAVHPVKSLRSEVSVEGGQSNRVNDNPFLINDFGEYEIKEVFIQGIFSYHDNCQGKERGTNTIYTIEVEKIRLCHLGDLGQKELDSCQLEKIGDIDILMIPVGGNGTLDSKGAANVISQIEPQIVIPMHYQIPYSGRRPDGQYRPKLSMAVEEKLDGVDKFLKVMGQKLVEPQPKLVIKKKDLLEERMKIVVLKP